MALSAELLPVEKPSYGDMSTTQRPFMVNSLQTFLFTSRLMNGMMSSLACAWRVWLVRSQMAVQSRNSPPAAIAEHSGTGLSDWSDVSLA